MPRCNGSYIGIDANPTASAASGIWTVREAETYLRASKWPAQPGVPGAPTATAGNGQVSLTWSALTATPAITDYGIQYSSNGGSTWTTFSDGVGTATSATVTGLTNGTSYIFRLYGINALGEGPYGSASGTVTPVDDTTLLLHFDGSNGSTTFTDSSASNLTVTGSGSPVISTAQSKFGGSSLYLDGSSSLGISDSSAFNFGTGDFTIDFWLYADQAASNNQYVYDQGSNNGAFQLLNAYGYSGPFLAHWFDYMGVAATTTLADSTWTHFAVVRSGTTLTLYKDGVSVGSSTDGSTYSSTAFKVGRYGGGGYNYYGYIDEFRVVKGVAVWTSNFTPPTAPY